MIWKREGCWVWKWPGGRAVWEKKKMWRGFRGWDGGRWLKCLRDRESPRLIKNAFYPRLSRRMCKTFKHSGGARWRGNWFNCQTLLSLNSCLFLFDFFVTWHTISNVSFIHFLQSSAKSTLRHTAKMLTPSPSAIAEIMQLFSMLKGLNYVSCMKTHQQINCCPRLITGSGLRGLFGFFIVCLAVYLPVPECFSPSSRRDLLKWLSITCIA